MFDVRITQQGSCLPAQDLFPGVFKGSDNSGKYSSVEE